MNYLEKLQSLPKEESNKIIFDVLNKKAFEELSNIKLDEGVLNSLKVAKSMGYKTHYDIPEESDDMIEFQKRVNKMNNDEKEKNKNVEENK